MLSQPAAYLIEIGLQQQFLLPLPSQFRKIDWLKVPGKKCL